jgi:hypothetical protein
MDANEEGGRGRISRERKDEAMGRKLKQRERRLVGLKTASRVVGAILEEFYARRADCQYGGGGD